MVVLVSHLVLASQSPRRKELLEQLGYTIQTVASHVDESVDETLSPEEIVQQLSLRKAKSTAEDYPNHYVIGADTIVYLDGKVFGKPQNENEAFQMLKQLSGKTHEVFTGVSVIYRHQQQTFVEKASVTFWELTDDEVASYIRTGEPLDKAGAYGIQGKGALLVKKVNGDYYTIVGLPISRLYRCLNDMGFNKR